MDDLSLGSPKQRGSPARSSSRSSRTSSSSSSSSRSSRSWSRSRSRSRARRSRRCSRSYSRSRSRSRGYRRYRSRYRSRHYRHRYPRHRSRSRSRGCYRRSYSRSRSRSRGRRYYGFGRTIYPEAYRSWRSRSRSRSRSPLHLSEKDKRELLEIAKANAAKALGTDNIVLPASLKISAPAKEIKTEKQEREDSRESAEMLREYRRRGLHPLQISRLLLSKAVQDGCAELLPLAVSLPWGGSLCCDPESSRSCPWGLQLPAFPRGLAQLPRSGAACAPRAQHCCAVALQLLEMRYKTLHRKLCCACWALGQGSP
ncbi:arginine/serine-rich protein 1 isoform X3 [Cinclus cinclus]